MAPTKATSLDMATSPLRVMPLGLPLSLSWMLAHHEGRPETEGGIRERATGTYPNNPFHRRRCGECNLRESTTASRSDFPTVPPMRRGTPLGAHWESSSAVTGSMPPPLAEIFLTLAQPLRDGLAPVERSPADGNARRPTTACVPAIQRPFANAQFAGELFRGHIIREDGAGTFSSAKGQCQR